VALAGTEAPDGRLRAAREFVRTHQREDGLIIESGMPGPNYAWNGLALLAALAGASAPEPWAAALASGLLRVKGIALAPSQTSGQDNSLQAWSWTEGTFSWVEPTALCMLALKKAGAMDAAARTRLLEAEALLLNRVCDQGGWNYGNAEALGQDLRPYVPTTALALLAMQDRREHPAVTRSRRWLREHATSEPSTMALSLAAMCLQTLGEDSAAHEALARHVSASAALENFHWMAMAACALSDRAVPALTVDDRG
jgi:hypothetical protein